MNIALGLKDPRLGAKPLEVYQDSAIVLYVRFLKTDQFSITHYNFSIRIILFHGVLKLLTTNIPTHHIVLAPWSVCGAPVGCSLSFRKRLQQCVAAKGCHLQDISFKTKCVLNAIITAAFK